MLPRLVEEVRDRPGAVVFGDEGLQRSREFVLDREREPFLNVIANDLRARARAEDVVRVAPLRLVFDEILWSRDLADVVVVGADTSEQRVGADGATGRLGEIRHGDRVCVGARRLEAQALQQRTIQIGPFEQREVRLDARECFDHRQQQHGKQHAGERIQNAEACGHTDLPGRKVERQPDRRGGREIGAADRENPLIRLIASSNLAHRERRDRAADEIDEQRVRAAIDALASDECREHHRGDDADPPVEQRAENDGGERDGHELRMHRPKLRHERAADDHERGDRGDGSEPSNVDVDLRPELHERQPEQRDEQEVEDDRSERSPRTALVVAILVDRVVQRAQFLVLLAAHDFVRANDLLPREHVVLGVGDRPAHLLATELRRGVIRHDRRMEERRDQPHVQ